MITRLDVLALAVGVALFGSGAPARSQARTQTPSRAQPPAESPLAEVLEASAAGPDHADALNLYGQFVGDWEFDLTNYRQDGSRETGRGEWRFGWVLEGRAIQDVWRVPSRRESARNQAPLKGLGTTLRTYDPKRGVWTIVFAAAVTGTVTERTARQEGSEIVQAGLDPATGLPTHWIFSRILPDSFHWRAVVSKDGGASWDLQQEMNVRRKRVTSPVPAVDEPLTAPSAPPQPRILESPRAGDSRDRRPD